MKLGPNSEFIYRILLGGILILFLYLVFIPNQALAAYRDVIQAEGTLLNYWPMDDAGSPMTALFGGINLAAFNSPTFSQTGQVDGTAVSFDGINDYASSTAIDLSSLNKVVAEFLLYWDSYTNNDDLALEFVPNAPAGAVGFTVDPNGSTGTFLLIQRGNVGYSNASYTRPSAGAWHHIVAVFDKSLSTNEVNLYVDGTLQTPLSRPLNSNNTNYFGNDQLLVMTRSSGLFGAGDMQHLALYSDLSAARILAHAQEAGLITPLTAGTLSTTTQGILATSLAWTAGSGGTAPVTTQLQRSPAGANTWSNITGATVSPYTDTNLEPNTSYDYRVAYTDAEPTTVYSATVTVTTNTGTEINWSLNDLFYNDRDGSETPRHSTFATLKFTTDDSSLEVVGTNDIYSTRSTWAELGVRVDGVDQTPLSFTAEGGKIFTVNLGAAGTSRTVEILGGLQTQPSSVKGSYLISVAGTGGSTRNIIASSTIDRALIYGDSIAVGSEVTNPTEDTWTILMRNTYSHNPLVEAWGYRSLYTDANTAELLTAFVSKVSSYNPKTIWLAIGTNDYGLNKWNAASFGAAYSDLLDSLNTALPDAKIVCQTPLPRSTETANGSGSILDDYRDQISTVCANRSYAIIVAGSDILTTSSLIDGIHPSDAGNVIYAQKANNILTITPTVTTAAASSITSTTVTLNGSISNVGSTTPTTRGFAYGLTTSYELGTTTDSGSFSVGDFTSNLADLTSETTYHFRAYATNFAGTDYGDDVTFLTDDSTAPVRSAGLPSGAQAAGTTEVTLSLTTNETATCKYGTTADTAYASIANTFTTTNDTTHSQTITGLSAGSYSYYIRCTDGSSNANTTDYTISFSITATPVAEPEDSGSISGSYYLAPATSQTQTTQSQTEKQQLLATLITLLNQLKALAAQAGISTSTTTPAFTQPLYLGLTHPQVKLLQQVLNQDPTTQVSTTGPGSPGEETTYFGVLTKQAVQSFQLKYQITTPDSSAYGYVGPKTRGKLNELLIN